jgi:hypothetical protein
VELEVVLRGRGTPSEEEEKKSDNDVQELELGTEFDLLSRIILGQVAEMGPGTGTGTGMGTGVEPGAVSLVGSVWGDKFGVFPTVKKLGGPSGCEIFLLLSFLCVLKAAL